MQLKTLEINAKIGKIYTENLSKPLIFLII